MTAVNLCNEKKKVRKRNVDAVIVDNSRVLITAKSIFIF